MLPIDKLYSSMQFESFLTVGVVTTKTRKNNMTKADILIKKYFTNISIGDLYEKCQPMRQTRKCGIINEAMGNFNRDDRGGGRSFGKRSFGGRSFDRGGGRREDRQMFDAICSNCGKPCQVPFRPTGDKPVYCSDCFEKRNTGSDSRRFENRNRAPEPQNMAAINAMNAKLDRILKILEPKIAEPVVPTPIVEEKPKEEVKTPVKALKAKKEAKKSAPTKKK